MIRIILLLLIYFFYMNSSIQKIDSISTHFNLPIYFNSSKMELSKSISTDLELTNTIDISANPMYDIILSPSNCFGKEVMQMFSEYYTTDVVFLKDTQQLLKTYAPENQMETESFDDIQNVWTEIKGETSFCEKYLYIDWEMGKFLNNNPSFLQMMSVYNVTSPIISFCLPIIILIMPFFIINMKGLNLTISEYVEILKKLLENHSLGKLFTNLNDATLSQQLYLLFSAALYVFSIYQNVLVCLRFYRNINNINSYLDRIKKYLHNSIDSFNYYLSISNELTSYADFNKEVARHKKLLEDYLNQLNYLGTFTFSWSNIMNIGKILSLFYNLYSNAEYNKSMVFSFGLHGYLNNIYGLRTNITNKKINYSDFSNEDKETSTTFKQSYYPALMNEEHIKNTCDFSKNMIITGPNASGKTTILKSSLINVILSQQFGCGCYESANISPYKFIHCYLNIPDTSGRDSLFQAEARRCKTIIDTIGSNTSDRHFCAFDELYSGTNPEDAVSSSLAFMKYLLKFKNVSCILTTHYTKVCKQLDKKKNIKNYRMKTIETANSFRYTYILEKGISNVKGGLKVLSDMNYPTEIISNSHASKKI
jgi:hypothetical protein